MAMDPAYPGPTSPMIGAQLRTAAEAVHGAVFTRLEQAGFGDLRPAHFALMKFPGPHGVRPTELAAHVGLRKQALNPLLRELETLGYLHRTADGDDGRGRVLHLTERGFALARIMRETLDDVETGMRERLGTVGFDAFVHAVGQVGEAAQDAARQQPHSAAGPARAARRRRPVPHRPGSA